MSGLFKELYSDYFNGIEFITKDNKTTIKITKDNKNELFYHRESFKEVMVWEE